MGLTSLSHLCVFPTGAPENKSCFAPVCCECLVNSIPLPGPRRALVKCESCPPFLYGIQPISWWTLSCRLLSLVTHPSLCQCQGTFPAKEGSGAACKLVCVLAIFLLWPAEMMLAASSGIVALSGIRQNPWCSAGLWWEGFLVHMCLKAGRVILLYEVSQHFPRCLSYHTCNIHR